MTCAVFVGMPGAGKSTIGRRVASALGVPFADSDELVVAAERRTIPEIFATGEDEFRRIEERVIVDALENFDGILSLGGGAVLSETIREALRGHTVVLLDADDSELFRRISSGKTTRPLLTSDPAGRLRELHMQRNDYYYELATFMLDSTGLDHAESARRITAMLTTPSTVIEVAGEKPYSVIVGRDLVYAVIRAARPFAAALVVMSPDVTAIGDRIVNGLHRMGMPASGVTLERGEEAKTIESLYGLYTAAGDAGIGRDGVIIAVGGGATTDVGGFLAATWLRGIPVIQVPTSLLAMVDAAVGAKTGINTVHGKNLAGAFHVPETVICDIESLDTLPVDELRTGMGEVVKAGFICDREINSHVKKLGERILDPTCEELGDAIIRAIRVKANVVAADLRESAGREFLNYGHTLAHAIEKCTNYAVRHGEAVSIGCVFAAELGERNGVSPAGLADSHREILASIGLPTSFSGVPRTELIEAMGSDKKVRHGQLRFVVLRELGDPMILDQPEHLDDAFDAIGVA